VLLITKKAQTTANSIQDIENAAQEGNVSRLAIIGFD